MKLIIDIPDNDYEKLKDGHIPFSLLSVIENGIPLEKISDEIIELRSRQNVGVLECLDIIDKYRKGEGEC